MIDFTAYFERKATSIFCSHSSVAGNAPHSSFTAFHSPRLHCPPLPTPLTMISSVEKNLLYQLSAARGGKVASHIRLDDNH
jgi:hypothetical protein